MSHKKTITPQEQLKRTLRKIFRHGKAGQPHAVALYVIACIWMAVAVVNFMLSYATVASVFAGIGVFTLVFAFYADWKESRRKK